MLCLADRAFVGFDFWRTATATGADLLWRLRKNQVLPCRERLPDGSYLSRLYASPAHRRHDEDGATVRVVDYRLEGVPGTEPLHRLVTTLLDPSAAPAAELAALYHERRESEGAFAELKVGPPGERLMLRSRSPGGPRRAGALRPTAHPLRPTAPDVRGRLGGRPRPGRAVLPPRGADRAAASALPCRVFPLAGVAACMSSS